MNVQLARGLILALVATNVVWAYLLVDRSVTIQYQSDQLVVEKGRVDLLTRLVTTLGSGLTREMVMHAIGASSASPSVKVSGDSLEVGDLVFLFRDGQLIGANPL